MRNKLAERRKGNGKEMASCCYCRWTGDALLPLTWTLQLLEVVPWSLCTRKVSTFSHFNNSTLIQLSAMRGRWVWKAAVHTNVYLHIWFVQFIFLSNFRFFQNFRTTFHQKIREMGKKCLTLKLANVKRIE